MNFCICCMVVNGCFTVLINSFVLLVKYFQANEKFVELVDLIL